MLTVVNQLRRVILAATLGLIVMAAPPAHGGPVLVNNVTVAGVWSSPVLSGDLTTIDPITFVPTSQHIDNTATAVSSITGSMLQWGSGSSLLPTASSLTFVGATFNGALPLNTPLTNLGTLMYVNGESTTDTLIFGATLTLSIPTTSVTSLVALLGINTTLNSHLCDTCDADYISFLPPLTLNQTLNVFEGQSATFSLLGTIVGDPTIELTNLVLVPGQTGGFVGDGAATPEPGSLSLLGGALALAILLNRLRKTGQKGAKAS